MKLPVRAVIELLVAGEFDKVESLTKRKWLSAEEIARAVGRYGRTLVTPPDDAFELMDVVEVRESNPPQWSVCMPLWTQGEGRSDLSLELTFVAEGEGFRIELNDLHVL